MSHDSGEMMKKYIVVKQKQRLTEERKVLFQGMAEVESQLSCLCIKYKELDTAAKVHVQADEKELKIHREAEATTHLHFIANQKTVCSIESVYGTIELQLYTHKYIKKDNIIAISYDVLDGDIVSDSFYIIWTIEEGVRESD
ncbi:MAG: DUF1934 domain-containing protein [Erysipelotrichaceae bacterium]|nr:DUF1934 domain-containing protein [Erysipelotrichaceae bacterium]